MENKSDTARIASLSGLKPDQVRYDLKEHCILKGNQLKVTISDNEALKIISEKRNKLIWFDSCQIKPIHGKYLCLFSEYGEDSRLPSINMSIGAAMADIKEPYKWAYITPDMLPKGESNG